MVYPYKESTELQIHPGTYFILLLFIPVTLFGFNIQDKMKSKQRALRLLQSTWRFVTVKPPYVTTQNVSTS